MVPKPISYLVDMHFICKLTHSAWSSISRSLLLHGQGIESEAKWTCLLHIGFIVKTCNFLQQQQQKTIVFIEIFSTLLNANKWMVCRQSTRWSLVKITFRKWNVFNFQQILVDSKKRHGIVYRAWTSWNRMFTSIWTFTEMAVSCNLNEFATRHTN